MLYFNKKVDKAQKKVFFEKYKNLLKVISISIDVQFVLSLFGINHPIIRSIVNFVIIPIFGIILVYCIYFYRKTNNKEDLEGSMCVLFLYIVLVIFMTTTKQW